MTQAWMKNILGHFAPLKEDALPRISIYQRTDPGKLEAMIYEPVLCLILQGSKTTEVHEHSVMLKPGHALLVSHDLPVMSRITQASADAPYTALILSLDLSLVRSLYAEMAEVDPGHAVLTPRSLPSSPLAVAEAEPGWLDPICRYLALAGSPMDAQILGPGILREIHYRLIRSSIGARLRQMMQADSHANRIARAIGVIRGAVAEPIRVTALARHAGMSVSSFHDHFKAVTGTTPLQYQKDLRLIEARRLVLEESRPVAEAAFAVGYESPTHFSRDYTRKFGVAPSRDMLKGLAA